MNEKLSNKIRKYLTGLTDQEIQARISAGKFPFFGDYEEDCLDLAWEIISERIKE